LQKKEPIEPRRIGQGCEAAKKGLGVFIRGVVDTRKARPMVKQTPASQKRLWGHRSPTAGKGKKKVGEETVEGIAT